jgi:hypothetical protein
MQHPYRPQPGLKRRRAGGFNREHAAFIGGLVILAAFELLLAAKAWTF